MAEMDVIARKEIPGFDFIGDGNDLNMTTFKVSL